MENKFYIYGHYTADTNELFYVGKGTGGRAWKKTSRNPYWHNKVNKHGYEIKIIYDNLTESDAYIKEKELIAEVGLESLVNFSEGGKGMTSEDMKKIYENPEHLKKITEINRRITQNPEWRKKRSEISQQLAKSSEWRQKISTGVKNKYIDPEFKRKITETNRKIAQNPEWIKKHNELWNDPDWRSKHADSVRKATQTEEWKTQHKRMVKEVANRPEERLRRSNLRKQLLQDPEWHKKFLASQEHRKRNYIFVSPSGEITHIKGLNAFCKKNNLTIQNMINVYKGRRPHHKGWTKYVPTDI